MAPWLIPAIITPVLLGIAAALKFFASFVKELITSEREAAEKANEAYVGGMREMMLSSSSERVTSAVSMSKEREIWQGTIHEHTTVFKSMLEINNRVIQKVEALIDLNQDVLQRLESQHLSSNQKEQVND